MSVLEDLWNGKIYPSERSIKENHEYVEMLHKVIAKKDNLLRSLPSDLRIAVEEVMDLETEAAGYAERDAFITGFRLGVQLIMAGVGKETTGLDDIKDATSF